MVRPTKWMGSLVIAVALAGEASLAQAEPMTVAQVPTLARRPKADHVAASEARQVADYVADLSADDEDAASDTAPNGQADQDDSDAPRTEVIKERFPSGAIKVERQVTQDTLGNYVNHGTWKMQDEQGKLIAQGQFENGKRNGTWVRWYRSASEADLLSKMPYQQFVGPFVSQATFTDGQLDGMWTVYDSKMHKISQWSMVEGKRDGASTWWYPNGRKMREIQYRDGEMDGQYLEWSPDATLKTKDTYEAGRKLAQKTAYHKIPQKKSEGTYLFAKEVEKTPDDWWNLKPATTVKSGHDEKHGPWSSWHSNGQHQLEGTYEHDVQVGRFVWWHSNGQKALEGNFDHGKQDGPWTWWHANGQKSIQGEYSHGNPTGRWTWWKEDGKVAQSADLSGTEGVVIDTPRTLDPSAAPRVSKPTSRQPIKR